LVRTSRTWIALSLAALLLAWVPAALAGSAKTTTKKSTPQKKTVTTAKKKKATSSRRRVARRGAWKRRGQQQIASERVRQIQEALIREKQLNGEATGVWDDRTKTAMLRYQAENGWQAKIAPDSRALIKLGLGPNMAGLLNPTTAILPMAPAAGGGEVESIEEEELAAEEGVPETQD
jgi:peptidoglycan hydrolase-like protein with peptidoglycan-binding domain